MPKKKKKNPHLSIFLPKNSYLSFFCEVFKGKEKKRKKKERKREEKRGKEKRGEDRRGEERKRKKDRPF